MERYLEPLDLADTAGIVNWHERFTLWARTNPNITNENRTAFYLTMVGKDGYNLLKDLAFPQNVNTRTVADLQMLLQGHLQPTNFMATERARFHNLTRRAGETLRSFLLRLQQQAAKCNFGNQLDIQLRDRIVAGVNDPEVQKKLLREQQLTLQIAKRTLEEWDDVNNAIASASNVFYGQKQTRQGSSKKNVPQRKLDSKRGELNSSCRFDSRPQTDREATSATCDSCGGLHLRKTCRFRHVVCRSCNRQGHIAKVCRSEKVNYTVSKSPAATRDSDNSSVEDIKVFTLSATSKHLFHTLRFKNGQTHDFIVDTGSPISFMPLAEFHKLGFKDTQLCSTSATIKGVSGQSLPVVGQSTMFLHSDQSKQSALIDFVITKSGPSVLGLDGLRALEVKVVSANTAPPTKMSLSSTIRTLIHQCSHNTGGMTVNPIHLETTAVPCS